MPITSLGDMVRDIEVKNRTIGLADTLDVKVRSAEGDVVANRNCHLRAMASLDVQVGVMTSAKLY